MENWIVCLIDGISIDIRSIMTKTKIKQKIHASPEFVFRMVSNVKYSSGAINDITRIEYLSKHQKGEGTIFREIRNMNGKTGFGVNQPH